MSTVTLGDVTLLTAADRAAVALACSSLGWRVIPLRPTNKRPILKGWPERATTDPDVIESWWSPNGGDFPDCNVGVATGRESGIWILDVDTRGADGFASLRRLLAEHSETELPRTFTVRTPSGGVHYYFRYPADGREIKNSASRDLGAGLDVRGWHGQAVAPGTRIVTEAGVGSYDVIDGTAPVEAPAWLVGRVEKRPYESTGATLAGSPLANGRLADYALRALENEAGELAAMAADSGRNDKLNRAAFSLGGLGAHGALGRDEVYAALREACERNGVLADDGERQFDATFDSGWNAGLRRPRDLSHLTNGRAGDAEEVADDDRNPLRFRSLEEVRRTRTPVRWLVREVMLADAFAVLGGAEKTLKSWIVVALSMAVAAGRPLFCDERFAVAAPGRVLVLSGEGGADLFLDRLDHLRGLCEIDLAELGDRIEVTDAIRSTTSTAFREGLRRRIEDADPALVVLDPAYAYVAADEQAGNVFKMGRLLADLRDLCKGRAVLIGHHFTKAGRDDLSLGSLTQAGFREVADHWLLVAHAAEPDLVDQRFRLRARLGARRGFGWDATFEVALGALDLDTLRHRGDPEWRVLPPTAQERERGDGVNWRQLVYERICEQPDTETKRDIIGAGEGTSARARALAWLESSGLVRSRRGVKTREDGRPYRCDLWGPVWPGAGLDEAVERARGTGL